MEAQELRIGNYAMGNKPFAVDSNHIAMAYNHEIAQNGHERFKSIPLTEDWLIRFGFEKRNGSFSIYLSELERSEIERKRIDIFFGAERIAAELCRSGICFSMVTCNYVHQLQNLYFALTSEELTLEN
jgi:hypothetical protein